MREWLRNGEVMMSKLILQAALIGDPNAEMT
jgi:hypothetical protein